MKLKKLKIKKYKNLENLEIDFMDSNITAVLGQNGCGKSNLFEFISEIFLDIDEGKKPSSNYKIEYSLWVDSKTVNVTIEYDSKYKICIDSVDDKKTYVKVPKTYEKYLPRFIFAYYSGTNQRLKKRFDQSKIDFQKSFLKRDKEIQTRKFLYAEKKHSLFVLLIFLLLDEQPQIKELLKEILNIESLSMALFKLHRPYWAKDKNSYFWGSKGFVSRFLQKLYENAIAPIKLNATSYTQREQGQPIRENTEFIYLYFDKIEKLKSLMNLSEIKKDETSDRYLFKAIESMYISDLVEDIVIKTNVNRAKNTSINFDDLSEGEMQLFTVLGLLKFTNTENSLFLLDEPDTHLNPNWSRYYVNKYIRNIIGSIETSKTHVLLTTHDPVLIGGLKKEDVVIMQRMDDNSIKAEHPETDPMGSSYDGILTGDGFDLGSSISPELEETIERKMILLFKDDKTPAEELELKNLKEQIKDYDYAISNDDPLYNEYLKAKFSIIDKLGNIKSESSTKILKKLLNIED